jgi:hypothetical protein
VLCCDEGYKHGRRRGDYKISRRNILHLGLICYKKANFSMAKKLLAYFISP